MAEETYDYLTKRLNSLKQKRENMDFLWDVASKYCGFDSGLFLKGQNDKIIRNLFDSTAKHSLSCFASALKSILIPTTQKWHRLRPSDPSLEENINVKRYCDYVNDLLFKYRYGPTSKFAFESHMMFIQMGIYGHSVMFVTEDVGRGILYKTLPIREIYIDHDYKGDMDTVYRVYTLTARQALKEFGNRATSKIKERALRNPEQIIELLHAVGPREDIDISKKDYRGMRYVSYHVNLSDKEIIYEGGYRTMPYMVPRYEGLVDLPYSDSPALKALCDILSSNDMAKTILRVGQLQSNPPFLTSKGLKNASRLGSAGAIVSGGLDAQGRPMAQTLQMGNNLNITAEMQERIKQSIEQAFHVDLFQALTQTKQMTAREVDAREAEKAAMLAPMQERISAEWFNNQITRELDILREKGELDGVPDELLYEGSLEISFESPAVHMQKTSQIRGIYKTIESAMSISQVEPGVLDMFNWVETIKEIADYEGVPAKLLLSDDELSQKQAARASAQEAQQLLQAAPVLAGTLKDLKQGGMNVV